MAKTDQLQASVYFSSPAYSIEIPEWVDDVNKICDKYVEDAKKNNAKIIKEREKKFGKKIGDFRNMDPDKPTVRKCAEIAPRGPIVVFPSHVWHRVKPVTKGTRYSLVIWNLGYPFR